MKNGCKVKVLINDQWKTGTLIKQRTYKSSPAISEYFVGIGEKHYFNYEEKWVDPTEVKEYIELSLEAADAIHAQELPIALKIAQDALAALIPNQKLEVKEGAICGYYGYVTLDPVVTTKEFFGTFRDMALWQVTKWKHYPATRCEPEDRVDCPIGEACGYNQAVPLFIETIFKAQLEDYCQAKADEVMAVWAKEMDDEGPAYVKHQKEIESYE